LARSQAPFAATQQQELIAWNGSRNEIRPAFTSGPFFACTRHHNTTGKMARLNMRLKRAQQGYSFSK
jgi:hypothetical protein